MKAALIVTQDDDLARELRALRNQGRYETDAWHQHSILGFNYRLSELNCALGLAQMQRLDEILAKRAAVAATYHALLEGAGNLLLPKPGARSWFVYVVRLTRAGVRDQIMSALAADGIQCGRYFAPIHQQPAYAGWPLTQPLPVTEAESLRTLALPFSSTLTQNECAYVADKLKQALRSFT